VCRAVYRGAYAALRSYWFVRRPDVRGVKCVLTNGELVLLVRHTYGHREWDLPGGSVRRGEDPAAAATREMQEELGVVVHSWTDLGHIRAQIDHRRDTMHCYTADISGQPIVVDPCELATVRWFPRAGLPDDVGRFVTRIMSLTA
jgi:8-oxo-dGTP diphosphatase